MSFDSPTLYGTPNYSQTWPFTITVYDGASQLSSSKSFTWTVGTPSQPLSVSSAASPASVSVGQQTTFVANPAGGSPPYTYTWSGAVTGTAQSVVFTPTANGTYWASVTVRDAQNVTVSSISTVTVGSSGGAGGGGGVPTITTASPLPTAITGAYYLIIMKATGGTLPYTWTLSEGSPPPGLSFTDVDDYGVVSGTPTSAGNFNFTVRVTDGSGQSQTRSFSAAVETEHPLLSSFRSCLALGSAALICELPQGRYEVKSALNIGRSVQIRGSGGPGDTTLFRGSPSMETVQSIMVADPGVTNVVISNLTIDGNRYGFGTSGAGLSCLPGNSLYFDLDLRSGGTVWVNWMNFINAPGWALIFNGDGSSVSFSNFGQGGYGIGPDGVLRNLSAAESATRSTAVWIEGDNNGARYNAIAHAGTAAINLHGTNQVAYGNLLQRNRYELSDGSQGGQLFLDPTSGNAFVAGNVINGDYWPRLDQLTQTTYLEQPDTGCLLPDEPQFNGGVEAYGFDHRFYNNEIEQHTNSGMGFGGSKPTGRILISSENPWDASDNKRFIEANGNGGIVFIGSRVWWQCFLPDGRKGFWYPEENALNRICTPLIPVAGVTLDRVLVRRNAWYGVALDDVSNYGTFTGFINDACMSDNDPAYGNVSPPFWTTLTSPVPLSYTSCPPDPGWASQRPPRSQIPGWLW
jgi:hypothetical protein